MKLFFLISALFAVSYGTFVLPIIQEWNNYKSLYGKNYPPLEDFRRKFNYIANKNLINAHNALFDSGRSSFKLGINQFTDWTLAEFSQMFGTGLTQAPPGSETTERDDSLLPAEPNRDWRNDGAVSPVEDQGRVCNHGWAFAAAAALEGQSYREYGSPLVNLSEQNLIDCATTSTVVGRCRSGRPDQGFTYAETNQNVNPASAYPNSATGTAGMCKYNPNAVGATCVAHIFVPANDEAYLQRVVSSLGPVAVGFDPTSFSFMHYAEGVYNEPICSSAPNTQRHHMAIVGYGTGMGGDYWIVKNSFGLTWGEQGYIRVQRNRNQCGIANFPVYPYV